MRRWRKRARVDRLMSTGTRFLYRKATGRTPSTMAEAQGAAFQAVGIAAIGIGLGYGAPIAARFYGSTAAYRSAMTWIRHPLAKSLVVSRPASLLGRFSQVYLQTSRVYRYVSYVAFAMNPLATFQYLQDGEYEKAMIQYFGPVGSVWVYNKYTGSKGKGTKPISPATPIRGKKGVGPSKMPPEQKKRLWRLGLRWCRKHRRYDRCPLRARK